MIMGFREDNPAVMFLVDHYIQKNVFAFLDTDVTSALMSNQQILQISLKKSVDVDENMKMQIINNRMTRANFKFPERHYAHKS